jgi:hypothetical protein
LNILTAYVKAQQMVEPTNLKHCFFRSALVASYSRDVGGSWVGGEKLFIRR